MNTTKNIRLFLAFKKIVTSNIFIAFGFALILSALDEYFLSGLQFYQLARFSGPVHPALSAIFYATTAVSFGLLAAFLYSSSLAPSWLKILSFVFFAAALLIQYSFQHLLGRYIVANDIQMGINSDLTTWLSAASLYFQWKPLIPILLFGTFLFLYRRKSRLIESSGVFSTLIFLIVMMSWIPVEKYSTQKAGEAINYGSPTTQFIASIRDYIYLRLSRPLREKYEWVGNPDTPKNNIVLIIDESVRADHLSVNGYRRATTPYLAQLSLDESLFHNWGDAVAGATCSELSNHLILTGLEVEGGNYQKTRQYLTVFQYAKAFGYVTYYFDSQSTLFWNGLSDSDRVYIDHIYPMNKLGNEGMYRDFVAADMTRDIVRSGTGNFIVINKYGVHFRYENDYPENQKVWQSTPSSTHPDPWLENLIDSYDNALLFNVDGFMRRLIPDLDRFRETTERTVYIYTSDHGQSLLENGAQSLHCGKTKPEARVPLIIIGKLGKPVDNSYRASHSNILPTILDLMAVPDHLRAHPYNVSLLSATKEQSQERFYFNGQTNEVFKYDE
jgi:glucan phosphoethanolaminetransferase (alkaline phosphatase superfamily)